MFSHERGVGAGRAVSLGCEMLDGPSVELGGSGRTQAQLLSGEMMIARATG